MNKTLILTAPAIALSFALGLAFTAPAFADSDDPSCAKVEGKWMSKEKARERAMLMGYDARKVKTEDGCYEIYATNKDGERFEIFMHPVTGKVVETKKKS